MFSVHKIVNNTGIIPKFIISIAMDDPLLMMYNTWYSDDGWLQNKL